MTLFIGDIGINHNGDLDLAYDMLKMAKRCGIDIVKFQKRTPEICVPDSQKNKPKIFRGKEMTYFEYKKLIEFDRPQYDIINNWCKRLNIFWTASVWDIESFYFMLKYKNDIPFIKIPSACITNMDLIKEINKTDLDVIMSDGMSTLEEIENAIHSIKNLKGIMHCNSSYPCSWNEIDLAAMDYYTQFNIPYIGYSGHEEGYLPTLIAYARGANLIERHITTSKYLEGSDQMCSLDAEDLIKIKAEFKTIDNIMGKQIPKLYDSELPFRDKLRQKK